MILDSGGDDVVDKPGAGRLSTAGVDSPTIHQVKQGTEPHQLHLGQRQVQVGEADVGQAGEGRLDCGVYDP